jgi:hypothetical protein
MDENRKQEVLKVPVIKPEVELDDNSKQEVLKACSRTNIHSGSR